MSNDDDRTQQEGPLAGYFLPRTEFEASQKVAEKRFTDLRRDVDDVTTRQDSTERRVNAVEARTNEVEIEQKVSKAERIGMLAIQQSMERDVHQTAVSVRKIEHLQMFGWACVGVLLICVLIRVW